MAWWWGALVGIEAAWVLGLWPLLAAAPGRRATERLRAVLVPAYFLYHVPLLLVDLLGGGWASRLLEGKRWWLLPELVLIGAATVLLYGAALDFLFAPAAA